MTALALETFIVRPFRENNPDFLKAFSDQPEFITRGMSPLKNIMKELYLRTVHIYPRSVILTRGDSRSYFGPLDFIDPSKIRSKIDRF